jgi:hypothetical protein
MGRNQFVNYLRFLHAKENSAWLKKSEALLPFCDIVCDVLIDFFHHNVKCMDDEAKIVEDLALVDEAWFDVLRELIDSLHDICGNFFRALKRRTDKSKKVEKVFKALAKAAESTLNLKESPRAQTIRDFVDGCQKFARKLLTRKPSVKPKVEASLDVKPKVEASLDVKPKVEAKIETSLHVTSKVRLFFP